MASYRYSIYPASFVVSGPTTYNLQQIESYGFSPNQQKSPFTAGGALDRSHVGLAQATPMHRFGTRDLVTIFTTMGVSPTVGLALDGTDPAVTFRYQERKCEDGFETGATHITRTAYQGFLKPQTLSASAGDQQGALLNCEVYSISNGGLTASDDKNDGVDFAAAPAPAFVSRFFFGPIYVNSVKQEGMESFNLDFGIECVPKHFDFPYPQCHPIVARNPRLTFNGSNAAIDNALDSFINNQAGAIEVYLRKGAHGQARVADVTTSHFKLTIATGEWSVDEESVNNNEDVQSSFAVLPTGTIAVSTSSAIP